MFSQLMRPRRFAPLFWRWFLYIAGLFGPVK